MFSFNFYFYGYIRVLKLDLDGLKFSFYELKVVFTSIKLEHFFEQFFRHRQARLHVLVVGFSVARSEVVDVEFGSSSRRVLQLVHGVHVVIRKLRLR